MVLLVLRMDLIIRMSPILFLLPKATDSSRNELTTRGLRSTREWFRNSTNLDRTISALSTLSSDFTDASYNRTVIAIELVNEPFPQSPDEVGFLRDFYQRAYGAVRGASKDTDMVVALDAAFQGLGVWEGFMTPPDFYEVAIDTVCQLTP
jgi:glucan 1,3-beta-glucosidase